MLHNFISGLNFDTSIATRTDALKSGIRLWAQGMNRLVEDMIEEPKRRIFSKGFSIYPHYANYSNGKHWAAGGVLYE